MDAESSYPVWDVLGKVLIFGILIVLVVVGFIVGFNFVNDRFLQ